MTPPPRPYHAPAWLPGGNAQTLWPLLIKPPQIALRRERWTTPDGDFIDVDHLDGPADAPLLVLFHGLEGSARSHYARSTAAACQARGWRFALPHFRGCSGELNHQPRAYHSGDSAVIDWILRRLKADSPDRLLHAAGVSLGGNALLKWAGEQGTAAREIVSGVAAIKAESNIDDIEMESGDDYTYMHLIIQVNNRQHLAQVMRGLRHIQDVIKISRIKD